MPVERPQLADRRVPFAARRFAGTFRRQHGRRLYLRTRFDRNVSKSTKTLRQISIIDFHFSAILLKIYHRPGDVFDRTRKRAGLASARCMKDQHLQCRAAGICSSRAGPLRQTLAVCLEKCAFTSSVFQKFIDPFDS